MKLITGRPTLRNLRFAALLSLSLFLVSCNSTEVPQGGSPVKPIPTEKPTNTGNTLVDTDNALKNKISEARAAAEKEQQRNATIQYLSPQGAKSDSQVGRSTYTEEERAKNPPAQKVESSKPYGYGGAGEPPVQTRKK